MSDHDILQRASKALRDEHDGRRAGSGFTRARIMKALHERRRRRLTWWFTLGPAIAFLLGGSAWAQSTGNWPVVWQNIAAVFSANPPIQVSTQVPERAAPNPPRTSQPAQNALRAPEVTAGELTEPEEELTEPEEAALENTDPALAEATPSPKPVAPRVKRRAPEPSVEPTDAENLEPPVEGELPEPAEPLPSEPERDPELKHFRRAHDLHYKQGSPIAAIAAYRDYLVRYPSGRFVPEARYNIALSTLKLGHHDEARRMLAPFAAGHYGSNRKAAAQALLDSLK